jgi:hypothetical protein
MRKQFAIRRKSVVGQFECETPTQAAGVDSRCLEMSDMVAMIEGWEAANEA